MINNSLKRGLRFSLILLLFFFTSCSLTKQIYKSERVLPIGVMGYLIPVDSIVTGSYSYENLRIEFGKKGYVKFLNTDDKNSQILYTQFDKVYLDTLNRINPITLDNEERLIEYYKARVVENYGSVSE